MAASDIPETHHAFAVEAAETYFSGRGRHHRKRSRQAYDLAILHNPIEALPPSNARALRHFIEAGERVGFDAELITREDYGHIGEYDALLLRETTAVNHHTYRFARRAAAEGVIVIDDPASILKCTNKVFLAELLSRKGIPTPKTTIVHKGNVETIGDQLGFPCILKQPDSSFSQGVIKVETAADFEAAVTKMLTTSALVIAQEFMPTPFDWRIGIIGGQALFACKYFMAKRHWQIYHHDGNGKRRAGNAETLAIENAPRGVVRLALKAANLIGDGLYGVDIKQVGNRFYVIEVNDNPNVDSGVEDEILKDSLYDRILGVLLERVTRRAQRTNPHV